jgi:uncharacterized secreted protein with C-terminal beta-propeller domain
VLSLGGSSPYASRDKTNKNKYTQKKQYKKHSTNSTKHIKYKYTYYQDTHTLQNTPITKQIKTTTVQVKTTTVQIKTTTIQVKTTTVQDVPSYVVSPIIFVF